MVILASLRTVAYRSNDEDGEAPIPVYNCRRDEHSDGHEYFVLALDRGTCGCDVALGRLGERSA
jgi:hypothetical protein